jgi:hypothetical protein
MEREIIRKEKRTRQVIHEPITGEWTLSDYSDEGERRLPENGLQYGSVNKNVWSIREGDPLSARNRCEWELTIGRGQWQTKVQTCSDMWSDETTFYLVNKLVAFEGDKEIFSKTWETEIDRDHV